MIVLPVSDLLFGAWVERVAEHVKTHIEGKAAEGAAAHFDPPPRPGLPATADCGARWDAYSHRLKVQFGPAGTPAGPAPDCPRPIRVR